MQNLSNRAIISRLYSAANQHLEAANINIDQWSNWYTSVQDLILPEKMVYVIVHLNKAVTEGGFEAFYTNNLGIFAPEIVHALNEIQATETADIVERTLHIVNPDGLLDDAFKEFVFNVTLSESQVKQLYAQDVRYDQLHGNENLEDLLGDYLKSMISLG